MTKEEYEKSLPSGKIGDGSGLIGWKPLHDEALAVLPSQVKEAQHYAEKHGVPTDFDSDGCPIYRTRQHRKAYHKLMNVFDRGAGYGDQAKQR